MCRVPVAAQRSVREDELWINLLNDMSNNTDQIGLIPRALTNVRGSIIGLIEEQHLTGTQYPSGKQQLTAADFPKLTVGRALQKLARSALAIRRADQRDTEPLLGTKTNGPGNKHFVVWMGDDDKNITLCKHCLNETLE